ncbi:probable tRNA methyltransferase 9B [Stegostoma tigrinum]|uniref:probable tRNA methyltransferase 9B n=1 Tax=Stegostoma tigrinum TaxID=3053191 RepID=UPI00202B8F9B|nr:probable tRNA methyltransferase 9B [Stegostoma tigrinum]XP_048388067.1 probable tRNA methyltransferase 9B [Stegostoma tigrinum]XP_048388068.1 probable tRNA methyltransferase 9B [Stegostoma tigrinum]XP_048388071.1 probable tRNA methyltransferase 9B [Stegostoma tigrinum]XP_048388072.1 probable tRNA methyltransferase 9B [Stegostoma tigrinum]
MDKEASRLEKDYVHNVYERIAPHFNDSRYKAWPRVRQFLLEQDPGSLIADVGCGNGKYLCINKQAYNLGCDYCLPLVESAREQSYETMVCDSLHLPYRNQCFDAILSIAVVHHFSTKQRRIQAIKEMARILRVRGKMMIYVWAMEQSRRKFEKQDIFIPWNPTPPPPNSSRSKILNEQNTSFQQINNDFFHKDKPLNSNRLPNNEFSMCKKYIKGNQVSSLVPENTLKVEKSLNVWIFSQSLNSSLQFSSNNRTKSPKEVRMLWDYITSFKTNNKSIEQGKTDNVTRFESNVFSCGQSSEDIFGVFSKSRSISHYNGLDSLTSFFEHPCMGSFKMQESSGILRTCSEVSLPDLTSQALFQNQSLNCANENESTNDSTYENINSMHPQMQRNVTTDSSNWPLEPHVLAKGKKDQINYNSTCLRYYHVFKQGELIELIEKHIEDLQVIQTYYDHANWCVVVEKVRACKI